MLAGGEVDAIGPALLSCRRLLWGVAVLVGRVSRVSVGPGSVGRRCARVDGSASHGATSRADRCAALLGSQARRVAYRCDVRVCSAHAEVAWMRGKLVLIEGGQRLSVRRTLAMIGATVSRREAVAMAAVVKRSDGSFDIYVSNLDDEQAVGMLQRGVVELHNQASSRARS